MATVNKRQEYLDARKWVCESSPTGAHHWIINHRGNWGYCRYCHKEREFRPRVPDWVGRPDSEA